MSDNKKWIQENTAKIEALAQRLEEASYTDVSDTTATSGDVATGKVFYDKDGVKTEGSGKIAKELNITELELPEKYQSNVSIYVYESVTGDIILWNSGSGIEMYKLDKASKSLIPIDREIGSVYHAPDNKTILVTKHIGTNNTSTWFRVDYANNTIVPINPDNVDMRYLSALGQASNGDIWFGTGSSYYTICKYDYNLDKVVKYTASTSGFITQMQSFWEGEDGTIYGTSNLSGSRNNAFFMIDETNKEIVPLVIDTTTSYKKISFIGEDDDNIYATSSLGLYIINKKTLEYTLFQTTTSPSVSIVQYFSSTGSSRDNEKYIDYNRIIKTSYGVFILANLDGVYKLFKYNKNTSNFDSIADSPEGSYAMSPFLIGDKIFITNISRNMYYFNPETNTFDVACDYKSKNYYGYYYDGRKYYYVATGNYLTILDENTNYFKSTGFVLRNYEYPNKSFKYIDEISAYLIFDSSGTLYKLLDDLSVVGGSVKSSDYVFLENYIFIDDKLILSSQPSFSSSSEGVTDIDIYDVNTLDFVVKKRIYFAVTVELINGELYSVPKGFHSTFILDKDTLNITNVGIKYFENKFGNIYTIPYQRNTTLVCDGVEKTFVEPFGYCKRANVKTSTSPQSLNLSYDRVEYKYDENFIKNILVNSRDYGSKLRFILFNEEVTNTDTDN